MHQGPGGHPAGTHEYRAERAAAEALRSTRRTDVGSVKVEVHTDGWPRDPATLDDADTIVVLSDGADRNAADHPLLAGDRLARARRQMASRLRAGGDPLDGIRAAGPRRATKFLEWIGGYFDYQSGTRANQWYSKIQTANDDPASGYARASDLSRAESVRAARRVLLQHSLSRARSAAGADPGDPDSRRIARTRSSPGPSSAATAARGFGFTGGHFFDNWGVDNFRRMVLNAIVVDRTMSRCPPAASRSKPPRPADPPVAADDRPIQAVIVTGHQHPAHLWRDTTVALEEALAAGSPLSGHRGHRPRVSGHEEPVRLRRRGAELLQLAARRIERRRPRQNFQKYLSDGGGLAIIHFANGAFHNSLPETPPSDWPEFRNICRRVWDHGTSSHDPYGRFQVDDRGRSSDHSRLEFVRDDR